MSFFCQLRATAGQHTVGLGVGILLAWHSLAAALGAWMGGEIFEQHGSYDAALVVCAIACLAAAVACVAAGPEEPLMRKRPAAPAGRRRARSSDGRVLYSNTPCRFRHSAIPDTAVPRPLTSQLYTAQTPRRSTAVRAPQPTCHPRHSPTPFYGFIMLVADGHDEGSLRH